GAAGLTLLTLPVDPWRAHRSVFPGFGVEHERTAGGFVAVVFHPVGGHVAVFGWLVVGSAQRSADFADEAQLLLSVAAGTRAAGGCGDDRGEGDGFGIDRGEQPRCTECAGFGADGDEVGGATCPLVPGLLPVGGGVGPEVAADEESCEHRV